MTTIEPAVRRGNWGPHAKAGAVSFTFDNLGEAAEIEMGLWPDDVAVGAHYTAHDVVPRLIREVKQPLSFFIEGWNSEVYPDTLRALRDAGHEIGMHGWRHEHWAKLDEDRQRQVFSRTHQAFRELGLDVQGFRPPGGAGSDLLDAMIVDHDMLYVSDVGFGATVRNDTVHLPFAWMGVDGVFLQPELGKAVGVEGADETGLPALVRHHKQAMTSAAESGDHVVFIFHSFLLGQDPARFDALFELIDFAQAHDDLWMAPCGEVAKWMQQERQAPMD